MDLIHITRGIEYPHQLIKEAKMIREAIPDYGDIDLSALVVAGLSINNDTPEDAIISLDTLMEELAIIRENLKNGPPKT